MRTMSVHCDDGGVRGAPIAVKAVTDIFISLLANVVAPYAISHGRAWEGKKNRVKKEHCCIVPAADGTRVCDVAVGFVVDYFTLNKLPKPVWVRSRNS